MQEQRRNIFERAFKRIVPGGDAARLSASQLSSIGPDLPDADRELVRKWIDNCLAGAGGPVAARSQAVTLGRAYLQLSDTGRIRFLELLSVDYGIDEGAVEQAIQTWHNTAAEERGLVVQRLRRALEPAHTTLLKQFNGVPTGVKFLVDMREELLTFAKTNPALAPLETDLRQLLATWYDIGLLQLEEITWQSSAALLEKLIAYEAVHTITSWSDLKNRLDSDRRCFAFFHPNMPDEPLIFVEVALVRGLASDIQKLLDEHAPTQDLDAVDTAIFYSISNAQAGLAGISFGNFLIKQVVTRLREELPQLKQFATLSPIPGFRRWLDKTARDELASLPGGAQWLGATAHHEDGGDEARPATAEDEREALMQLAAVYLCRIKHRDGARARDPVADFHLRNGAQVARLNWMADTSEKGLQQAYGLMVNYLYEPARIEQRSDQYTDEGTIALSSTIRKRLK